MVAVQDLWVLQDGTPSARHGRGRRYRVSVPGHPTKSFASVKAAQAHERTLWAAPAPSGDGRTMGELLDLWVASKAGLTTRARKNCVMAATDARVRWGGVLASEVAAHEVQAWLPSVGGVEWRRKVLQAVRGALAIAGVELGRVSVGRVVQRADVFLDVGEVRRLAGAAGRYGPMVWLLATTGVRIGECVRLQVGDVDVGRARLRVRQSKAGRPRDVPIPASVLAMLEVEDRPASAPLFVGHTRGEPPSADAFRQKVFHPAARAAKMPQGLRIHDLRHTAASLMILSGATVKDVQAALGHKSAAMTLDRYAGWWDTGLDEVGRRMDALVSGESDRKVVVQASSG